MLPLSVCSRVPDIWLNVVFLFIWAEHEVWRWGGLAVGGWAVRHGAGWAAQNVAGVREKEDISLELVTAGRGWAPFQLAWRLYQGMCVTGGLGGAVHCAAPFASKADAKWCDLSYGVCHGISTPTWHVFSFAFPRRCWLHFTYMCVCLTEG